MSTVDRNILSSIISQKRKYMARKYFDGDCTGILYNPKGKWYTEFEKPEIVFDPVLVNAVKNYSEQRRSVIKNTYFDVEETEERLYRVYKTFIEYFASVCEEVPREWIMDMMNNVQFLSIKLIKIGTLFTIEYDGKGEIIKIKPDSVNEGIFLRA